MTITLQLRANNIGVRYRTTLMLELTSLGAVLPSYDVATRLASEIKMADLQLYGHISLGLVLVFALLEAIDALNEGLHYFRDLWNVMDWINYCLFFACYAQILKVAAAAAGPPCTSYFCAELGYADDWYAMREYRVLKQYLSLCLCIQLFKVQKFVAQLVPKTGLLTTVMRTAAEGACPRRSRRSDVAETPPLLSRCRSRPTDPDGAPRSPTAHARAALHP